MTFNLDHHHCGHCTTAAITSAAQAEQFSVNGGGAGLAGEMSQLGRWRLLQWPSVLLRCRLQGQEPSRHASIWHLLQGHSMRFADRCTPQQETFSQHCSCIQMMGLKEHCGLTLSCSSAAVPSCRKSHMPCRCGLLPPLSSLSRQGHLPVPSGESEGRLASFQPSSVFRNTAAPQPNLWLHKKPTHKPHLCRCALQQISATQVAILSEGPASGHLTTATTGSLEKIPRPQGLLLNCSHRL